MCDYRARTWIESNPTYGILVWAQRFHRSASGRKLLRITCIKGRLLSHDRGTFVKVNHWIVVGRTASGSRINAAAQVAHEIHRVGLPVCRVQGILWALHIESILLLLYVIGYSVPSNNWSRKTFTYLTHERGC